MLRQSVILKEVKHYIIYIGENFSWPEILDLTGSSHAAAALCSVGD